MFMIEKIISLIKLRQYCCVVKLYRIESILVWGISKPTSLNIIWVKKLHKYVYNLLKVSQLFVVLFNNYCCQRINNNEKSYIIIFINNIINL